MSAPRIGVLSAAPLALSALLLTGAADRKEVGDARVFAHPARLQPTDELLDGENGKRIEISSETMLVWVDRMPAARFEHPTEYVLISAEGTRVVEGGWWPVLNGKPLFRSGKPLQAEFPIPLYRVRRSL